MALMTDEVKAQVGRLLEDMQETVTVYFHPKAGNPASDAMGELLREIAEVAPKVQVKTENAPPSPVAPESAEDLESSVACLSVGGTESGIRYLGFPGGHEFGPFVETIKELSQADKGIQLSPATVQYLQNLTEPLHLEVFVTPT